MGTSAGGNLAISLALYSLKTKYPLKGVAALAPVTIHPFHPSTPAEFRDQFKPWENEDAAIINAASMKTFFGQFSRLG
jgi:hypothetical protein